MLKYILLFSFLVSACNIALSYFTVKAAANADSWSSAFLTGSFMTAFCVGISSLIFMQTLYFLGKADRFGMANGIILMGATSIVGGTLFGYFRGGKLHWTEWVLFSLIVVVLLVRMTLPMLKSTSHS